MRVLAIETSCDETGIAIVEGENLPAQAGTPAGFEFKVLKNVLLSQAHLHAEYGGVYPNLAKREHEKNLPVLFEQFSAKGGFASGGKDLNVDAIAVTQGPGLEPALWQGIVFAQKLAREPRLPLLPVNHMEGHLISSLAQPTSNHSSILQNIRMSVLALLISGGHTEFVLMREWFKYEIIGETLDDAVGEAFDKVARMLGLPYPGGPEISKLAQEARLQEESSHKGPRISRTAPNGAVGPDHLLNDSSFHLPAQAKQTSPRDTLLQDRVDSFVKLPRPMIKADTCDVSFSGLKTAALYALRDLEKSRSDLNTGLPKVGPLTHDEKKYFAREFEDSVTDVFIAKTRRALQETGANTFVIGGGVAANTFIRESLQKLLADEFPDVEIRLPELSITGDNAIMIAEAALARALSGLDDSTKGEIRAVGNLSIAK